MFTDFKERGRGGERERKRNTDRLPAICTPIRDGTGNLGMCPDWELNPQPFGEWDDALRNWSTWPELKHFFKTIYFSEKFA